VRIALVTSRAARELVESYVRATASLRAFEVTVVDIPVHSISMLPAETIAKVIGRSGDVGGEVE
jgi:hypothetical protein